MGRRMEQCSYVAKILIIKNVDPLPPGFDQFAKTENVDLDVLDYREIRTYDIANEYDGLILSGTDLSPHFHPDIYSNERTLVRTCVCPVLGICGGFQIIATAWGAEITGTHQPIYGRTEVQVLHEDCLFKGLPSTFNAFSKHRYHVSHPPGGFQAIAESVRDKYLYAIKKNDAPVYGVQFHPERRLEGEKVLHNFLDIVLSHKNVASRESAIV
jgi:GMP synthase-like glutamine amidotransferase